jgi:hypothetical protein
MKVKFNFMALLIACIAPVTLLSCKKDAPAVKADTPKVSNTKRAAATLNFSGYTWIVKDSGSGTANPHNNYWRPANAYVDASGFLHLKITKDPATGRWYCGEVQMTQSLGYGTYQWKIVGRVDLLDKNVVFGLFNYSGNSGHDEMDIEFSRWGYTTNPMLNYTVYPAANVSSPANVHYAANFTLNGDWTTHRFKRTSNSIVFKSMHGHTDTDTNLFDTKTWNAPTSISTLSMPVFMNLWLFNNPPTNGQDVEIIIREFKFTPL